MTQYTNVLFWIVGVIVASLAIASIWILILDEQNDPGDLDLTALNSLNLIVGFLYIGVVNGARDRWKRLMHHANEFTLTFQALSKKADDKNTQQLEMVRNNLIAFYQENCSVDMKIQLFLKIQNSIDTLEASTNVDKLRQCAAALYRGFFEKEPFLFTAHLYLILGIYFACIPVQLFNAYDATLTYIMYPIIIYLLFAVPLYANAFHNPIQHPELNRTFQKLNTQIYTNTKQSKTYTFAYHRKDLRI